MLGFQAVLALAALAAAPTTAPNPTTAPVTKATALDQSTPKAFLKSFFASHGEVDEKTLRASLHAANPLEQKILDSVVQIELANGRLRAAEAQKFGKPATNPSMSIPLGLMGEIDTFVEKIEGDHATVTPPKDPLLAMQLVRVEGKWKLPIAALLGNVDPATQETMDASTHAQIEIIDAVATDVKSGKLVNEDQVRQELSKRMAERLAAATRTVIPPPATAPVSKPARRT
jgi:hypothetical protein